jgi:hypothetical protein
MSEMESKELPEDVTDIIHQYSKPVFIHFREYNEALRLFDLIPNYKEKLKTKIGEPLVLEQLKICIDARVDYKQKDTSYHAEETRLNQEILDKSKWWDCVSLEKLAALLDDKEYRMRGFAEWYFQDDIDDAWRNSDDSPSEPDWDAEEYEGQTHAVSDSDSD